MYADYAYYTGTYKGVKIPEDGFTPLALRASNYIDRATFGRVAEADDLIKQSMCALAECLFEHEAKDGIESEKVGEESVTYANGSNNISRRMYEVLRDYLSNTDLLQKGV